MFQIELNDNRLKKIEECTFSSLNLRERDHLQEWLAHAPEALGEELLIIQKEFDGFDETRGRLDLLALDKDGQLVIIENKLDDTGRDVVWQSLKYAAYCSSLTKPQILDIYQKYLDRYCGGGHAAEQIRNFLDAEETAELVLNRGNTQRVMMIAANFRKEVTSTAMWLLNNQLRIQCFKANLFKFGSELLLDLKQIIPPPEAAEYMIGMSEKESEEKAAAGDLKRRHKLRFEFWGQILDAMRENGPTPFQNISPSKDHWLNAGSGVRSCSFTMIFARDEMRVEIGLTRSIQDENKWMFDQLQKRREELEATFGAPFEWLRLDDKKASRIVYRKPVSGYDQNNWPEMIDWFVEYVPKLEATFKEPLMQAQSTMPDFLTSSELAL